MSSQRQESVWIDDLGIEGDYPEPEGKHFDYLDLTTLPKVTRLIGENVPGDLINRTKTDWFEVLQYYRLDDITSWRIWKNLMGRLGGLDRWLFYACPVSMVEDVLAESLPLPYGEFFPRLLGPNAIYLFSDPEQAARTALKFGLETEGFLFSCRVITGKPHKATAPNPQATAPPRGNTSVWAAKGTDLGSGVNMGDVFAVYNPDQILLRFISHIQRSRGPLKIN
jgi:hypothetical protein